MALRPRLASASPLTGNRPAAFRRALLHWYDRNGRDLPWRETRDPYRIWLSEIMLQQTRVAAVLEHYRIFLERFPNVQALAASSEDTVLAAWSGLGYYRRARMLHRCAQELVQKHDGQFPGNSEALLALPGIGRYTAAAIASIAFGETVAVVDGNVERVLQRLLGAELDASQTWPYAQALLDNVRPGDFNQAMMELGGTVCVPRAPRCLPCPVQKWCATGRGEVARDPGIDHTPAARQSKKQIWCALDRRDGQGKSNDRGPEVRLVQRSRKDSLMPGMWELPQTSAAPPRLSPEALWRTFRHSITVTDYTVHVLRNTELPAARGRWISIDRLPQIPITGLTRKILKAGGII
jgi:A/G-specific adenine glycosylase